jgi:[ribosomal protein S5]-alanine N-acetyltransferase
MKASPWLSSPSPPRFPVLRTKRLVLRELSAADAADVLVFRGDPEVQRYNSEPVRDVEVARTFIEELRRGQAEQKSLTWAVTLGDGEPVIGDAGFYFWNRYHSRAEVGYELARSQWGRGLGAEAVAEIIRFGFEQLGLNRIEASTIADNVESIGLLKKLGFHLEGLRRQYSWEDDGSFHDSAMYALLKDQWGR